LQRGNFGVLELDKLLQRERIPINFFLLGIIEGKIGKGG
jgi:hypothetical protein